MGGSLRLLLTFCCGARRFPSTNSMVYLSSDQKASLRETSATSMRRRNKCKHAQKKQMDTDERQTVRVGV